MTSTLLPGQGTIGIEILSDLPQTYAIIVPVGGGGLITGITIAAKALKPAVRITGAQAAACPSALESIRQKKPVMIRPENTIADGIRVAVPGTVAFPVLQELVDQIALASEDEIAGAMLMLLERKHVIAEGAGAVPLAVLLNGTVPVRKNSTVVLVVSGGNVDSTQLFRITRHSLARHGRIMWFSVLLDDRPGALAGLLAVISLLRGNILSIHHSQGIPEASVFQTGVELELETRGMDHIREIENALAGSSYRITRI